jgi:serine/threonine-protein kinase HipA
MGIHASRKYEREGGPSLRKCAEIVRRDAAFPLIDLQNLMRWTLFNLLVGNSDAHGKNLSLLYRTTGSASLAPFYDLVCTRNYKRLSRELAMNLGGTWDPDLVTTKHLDGLAQDLGFRPNLVLDQANVLADQILAALPTVAERYRNEFGPTPVLERVPMVVHKLIRRVKRNLKM